MKELFKRMEEVIGETITADHVEKTDDGYVVKTYLASCWNDIFVPNFKGVGVPDILKIVDKIIKISNKREFEIYFYNYYFDEHGNYKSWQRIQKVKVSIDFNIF